MKHHVSVGLVAALLLTGLPAGSATASSGERTYLVVSSGQPAGESWAVGDAAEDAGGTVVESYDAVGAAVAELTPVEAARLDAEPGTVVAPDTPLAVAATVAAQDALSVQAPSWGLDRLDERSATALDGTYTRRPGVDGSGVHVYVVDTGLAVGHPEFAGRVGAGRDFVGDGRGVADCNGHGTHVTGTIASGVAGVAPAAIVHPIRIGDCQGASSASLLLAALDHVATVAPRQAVVNVSMGGPFNAAINAAVDNVVAKGTPVVVAAGNQSADARGYSPASALSATTVAASDVADVAAAYSNYGPAIDVYAPGSQISSSSLDDPSTLRQSSGTSMAAPHVAGYLALYFDRNPSASVARAGQALVNQSTKDALRDVPADTPNRMVYTYAVAFTQKVSLRTVKNRTHLSVNVDPNVGAESWVVEVQRKQKRGFATVRTLRTVGAYETFTVNVGRGTYRAYVPPQYGYAGKTSRTVFVRR